MCVCSICGSALICACALFAGLPSFVRVLYLRVCPHLCVCSICGSALACEFLSLHLGCRFRSCQNHDARGEPAAGGWTRNQNRELRRPRHLRSAKKIHKPSRRIVDTSNRLCPLPIQAMNGRYIKQVMLLGQDAYQGITPVTTPGVHGQTRRLVDNHNVIAFMDDRDRSGSHGRLVPVHVVRDDVPVAAKNGSMSVL
jgi:hypothetical protein